MKREKIINLSKKNITSTDLSETKNVLQKSYEISYGKYTVEELKKAIKNETPFFIENNLIIGYEPNGTFISDRNDKIKIERMVKAIIIEDEKESEENEYAEGNQETQGDMFAIVEKNEWGDISEFQSIIGPLKVGEIFLPQHSVIFNFLNRTAQQEKEKIVSMLAGANINIYQRERYIDNCFHEIGHVFWRDCLKFEEKEQLKHYFKVLRPSAIYEYEWERKTEEEVFCTIYKWYLKSVLLNKSFFNILEYEEKGGLEILQDILNRIAKDRMVNDIWDLKKNDLFDFLNPKKDKLTGKKFIKKGLFEEIKDLELPDHVLNNIDSFQDGTVFIKLNKAVVPVKGNKIDWNRMK